MSDDYMNGKTIIEIQIASDRKAILFRCADGEHIARADGDCCSSTWIESIEAPAGGFPCTVISVDELSMPSTSDETECGDVITYYGCKLTTDKGDLVIDYRNESNGWYGGNLCWPDEFFDGGVFGQNVSDEEWQPVAFT